MFEASLLALQDLVGLIAIEDGVGQLLLLLFPFFVLIELPMNLLVIAGVLRWYSKKIRDSPI